MLHVVLYHPEIPPNTGNIGRTCVALNAKLWLVEPLGFQLDASKLRRAGMDYWELLNFEVVADWATLQAALEPRRFWLLSRFATRSHYSADFADEDVLVFGSESSGLPPSIHEQYSQHSLKVPILGPVRSLNLATTAGIVMYEAHRQIVQ